MPDYKILYFHLFNAVTDAIETHNYDAASRILMQAQQETEALYMDSEDDDEQE